MLSGLSSHRSTVSKPNLLIGWQSVRWLLFNCGPTMYQHLGDSLLGKLFFIFTCIPETSVPISSHWSCESTPKNYNISLPYQWIWPCGLVIYLAMYNKLNSINVLIGCLKACVQLFCPFHILTLSVIYVLLYRCTL